MFSAGKRGEKFSCQNGFGNDLRSGGGGFSFGTGWAILGKLERECQWLIALIARFIRITRLWELVATVANRIVWRAWFLNRALWVSIRSAWRADLTHLGRSMERFSLAWPLL